MTSILLCEMYIYTHVNSVFSVVLHPTTRRVYSTYFRRKKRKKTTSSESIFVMKLVILHDKGQIKSCFQCTFEMLSSIVIRKNSRCGFIKTNENIRYHIHLFLVFLGQVNETLVHLRQPDIILLLKLYQNVVMEV